MSWCGGGGARQVYGRYRWEGGMDRNAGRVSGVGPSGRRDVGTSGRQQLLYDVWKKNERKKIEKLSGG